VSSTTWKIRDWSKGCHTRWNNPEQCPTASSNVGDVEPRVLHQVRVTVLVCTFL
jgi:hypothetical protein